MGEKETKFVGYPCERLGQAAHVTVQYRCHRDGSKGLCDFYCDEARSCGVGEKGILGSWTFDWNICRCWQGLDRK
ncbi:MAG: hypothetical protein ACXADX_19120 [Candidatus Hodarchaeales archaeon]|jgi:hypothetical protein